MSRPASIVNFERFFWGSMIVGLISTAFSWAEMQATLERSGSAYSMTSVAVALAVFLGCVDKFAFDVDHGARRL